MFHHQLQVLILACCLNGMSHGLSPPIIQTTRTTSTTVSRRHALHNIVLGFGSAISFVGQSVAEEQQDDGVEETLEQKKARLMKERIAASKKNYRKADSYAQERFTTVDYSCVADTGSPCKEPKSVFPSDEQIAADGQIPDL